VTESVKTIVIIPTYNEIENVEAISRAVLSQSPKLNILFIDDNSPDGTAEKVNSLMDEFKGRIFLEQRAGKLGLGTAYIHGFKWAIANNYNYTIEMPRLLNACLEGADLTIGSRYCRGGKVKNWPLDRILMSYFASIYVRLILCIGIKDTTAGFKCYRTEVLKKINLDNVTFKGYAFQICMKYAALKHGFKVKEVPITFIDRVYGESKMSTGIFKEAFFGVWKMRKMNL
jgi:dolichol-phosphate mannosyltransferase